MKPRALPLPALLVLLLALFSLTVLGRILWQGLPILPETLRNDHDVLQQTLWMVGTALLLSLLLGTVLALVTSRARLPALADLLAGSAYFIPPFIGATAWLSALGPVNVLTSKTVLNLYSPQGIIMTWVLHYAPLAYLLVRAGLASQGDSMMLAGQIHGLSPWQILRRITWPLLKPSLGAAALLIGLSLLGNFGVPAVLGFPAKIYTLSTLAYARLLNPTLSDPLAASAAAAWLLLLVSIPLLLLPSPKPYAGGTPLPLPVPRVRRILAWSVVGGWFAFSFALPVGSTVLLAFQPAYASGWTLENFSTTLALENVRRGLMVSVSLALITALVCTSLGLLLARSVRSHSLKRVLSLPYFLPGTLLALGLIVSFGATPIYATPLLLLLAYFLRFLTPGIEATQSALTKEQEQLEFAARVHGLSARRTLSKITLPLLRPQLLNAVMMMIPLVLSEITLSALLYAPGAETAGVGVLNLLAEGNVRGAAVLSCILLVLTLPLALMSRKNT